jgi:hypothetical protein
MVVIVIVIVIVCHEASLVDASVRSFVAGGSQTEQPKDAGSARIVKYGRD